MRCRPRETLRSRAAGSRPSLRASPAPAMRRLPNRRPARPRHSACRSGRSPRAASRSAAAQSWIAGANAPGDGASAVMLMRGIASVGMPLPGCKRRGGYVARLARHADAAGRRGVARSATMAATIRRAPAATPETTPPIPVLRKADAARRRPAPARQPRACGSPARSCRATIRTRCDRSRPGPA